MRILIINPNTSDEITEGDDMAAKKYARADTEIKTVGLKEGPRSLESYYEIAVVAPGILERVIEGNEQGFDAIIVACSADSELEAAKNISRVPVYGIGEAAMHMASMFGDRFSIVVPSNDALPIFRQTVRRAGLESKCASIKAAELTVLKLKEEPGAALRELTEAARIAIKEDGAEVICLGCAGMTGLDKPMEEQLNVPVLDGVVCAVKIAEAAFDYKLNQSRANAFKRPAPKEWVGMERFRITD